MSTQREVVSHVEFLEDLQHGIETERHDPFSGVGKPEPSNTLDQGLGRGGSPRSTAALI